MLKTIRSVFTAERIEEAATMVYLKAIRGDVAAAKIMFTYAAGKGVPDVDPDRLNIDEWHLTVEEAVDARDMKAIMTRLPVGCANHITRAALPALGEGMMEKLGHVLRAPDSKAARRWIKKERFKAERAQREAERARRRAERAQQQAAGNTGPSAIQENERTAPQQPAAAVQEGRSQPVPDSRRSSAAAPAPHGDIGCSPPLPDGRSSSAAPSPHGDIGCSPPLPDGPDGRSSSPHEDPGEGPPLAHGDDGAPTPASGG
jgi:hypothetical protein